MRQIFGRDAYRNVLHIAAVPRCPVGPFRPLVGHAFRDRTTPAPSTLPETFGPDRDERRFVDIGRLDFRGLLAASESDAAAMSSGTLADLQFPTDDERDLHGGVLATFDREPHRLPDGLLSE